MSDVHHRGKANVVVDALIYLSMSRITHIEHDKKSWFEMFIDWPCWVFN